LKPAQEPALMPRPVGGADLLPPWLPPVLFGVVVPGFVVLLLGVPTVLVVMTGVVVPGPVTVVGAPIAVPGCTVPPTD
jgi:hypothetical protein